MSIEALIARLVPTLYEDEHLLAVSKPAGVDVGGTSDASPEGLVTWLASIRGHGETFRPANRLSRYESGVLVLGKEPAAAERIRAALKSTRVAQEYVAVVLGRMPRPQLAIEPGQVASKQQRKRKRPKTARPRRSPASRPQTTLTLAHQGERRAIVRCRTTVKNTHTLRAQLRSVGLRLVGDHLHDPSHRSHRPEQTCLHLARLSLPRPGAKSRISLSCPPPGAFEALAQGRREFERSLHAALVRRLPCLAQRDTNAYRLLTGPAEGVNGLAAERYGDVVILQVLEDQPALRESLSAIARWYRDTLGIRAVHAKHFVKDRSGLDDARADEMRSPKPLLGKPVPDQITIRERGLTFAVRPHEGFSVGLFLDHRDNRSRVRSLAQGKDMLNLFAYTCGFSVAAAAGGAARTVSVDLSPRYLEWGQANFELNGLGPANHEFVCSDASDYLRRAKRGDEAFDVIVLDPPSFAHGRKRGRDFSVSRDLPDLVSAAAAVLRPHGVMMVSTSYRRLSLRGLRERVQRGAGRRKVKIIETPPLPPDFAADPDHAKTLFARFD